MWLEDVVLLAPAISQGLHLSHRGKQLGVQEFIPEPAVDGFGKALLPRGTWLVVVVQISAQSLRAWAINLGSLLLRMNAGTGLVSSSITTITSFACSIDPTGWQG